MFWLFGTLVYLDAQLLGLHVEWRALDYPLSRVPCPTQAGRGRKKGELGSGKGLGRGGKCIFSNGKIKKKNLKHMN